MGHLQKRKIIKLGTSSLTVTLPKEWTRYFELKKGDAVEVISNDEVIIRPPNDISPGNDDNETRRREDK